ncbi:VTT domain-containing protein [Natronomonas halophila]|uniref:DedA family protein n=1 Tax=Natronomonas halophila TaxID=2747817 RepID=UPI0015B69AAB|nr:VTT domain-containing protein [Natronomonas halophila]QLD85098.1 VTT domain-containing protein [Natronomonas halophila]
MYTTVIDAGASLVAQYGVFALLVVFALEGALVGKVIPTRTLFVAAVLAIGTTTAGMLSVAAAAVAGATAGQVVLFALVRHTDVASDRFAGEATDESSRVARWFDRWGLSAVALSNTLPVARGTLTVPAAMTDENAVRFSASSMVGSSIYACGLLAVGGGIELLLTIA